MTTHSAVIYAMDLDGKRELKGIIAMFVNMDMDFGFRYDRRTDRFKVELNDFEPEKVRNLIIEKRLQHNHLEIL